MTFKCNVHVLYKVVITLESAVEILRYDHSNEIINQELARGSFCFSSIIPLHFRTFEWQTVTNLLLLDPVAERLLHERV